MLEGFWRSDYRGALRAGMSARLLRRSGEWSDGAQRASEEQEHLTADGVQVIRSLLELLDA